MTDLRTSTAASDLAPLAAIPASEPPLSVLIGLEGLALGGCPINALDLGWTLRQRGHRVSVFAIEEDVKVSLLPYAASRGFSPTLLPAQARIVDRARQIHELAGVVGADVTHVFGPWLGPAATAAMVSRRPGVAIVTNWMMENVFYTPRHTPVIVGTQRLRDELEPRHAGRVWLMEPPIDLVADAPDASRGREFRHTWGIGDDELAVVVVGRVDEHLKAEGLGYAIRAMETSDPRLRLVIVGDGDAFQQIRTSAEDVNHRLGRTAVVLTGSMSDPRPAYDAADIALGMGGSALRALAHGKPLVVLGQHGFARVFEPASADYFYDAGFYGVQRPDDPVRHLAALVQSLSGAERRLTLGEFGLSEVRARFGLETGAARLEQIYRFTLAHLPSTPQRFVVAAAQVARGTAREQWHALRGALG
ncbi:glycosyltransferase family 4 protein [Intrasporangium sp.]|uniref:glycosyltransferase family 4 protein n=1 Tax=Intrasporangium sp. TaxID=1925024 RepID=UPI003221BF3D